VDNLNCAASPIGLLHEVEVMVICKMAMKVIDLAPTMEKISVDNRKFFSRLPKKNFYGDTVKNRKRFK
jgi:hypothetical protein